MPMEPGVIGRIGNHAPSPVGQEPKTGPVSATTQLKLAMEHPAPVMLAMMAQKLRTVILQTVQVKPFVS